MREEIANDQRPTDGEIYRKIRQHSQNPRAAARYWACLSQNKQLELKRLLHRDDFKAAFDVSVPIPGLWKEGVRLGMIREILGSRCDEVSMSLVFLQWLLTLTGAPLQPEWRGSILDGSVQT